LRDKFRCYRARGRSESFSSARVVEIAHRKGRLTRRVKELLTNLAWGISPPLLAATRAAKAMLMGKRRKWAEMLIPPGWETGRNHLLVVGRRKADKV
jgi:hypothetical protein